MSVTWPGIVLVVLLGTLIGAGTAFFRARVLRDIPPMIGVSILGFAGGQLVGDWFPLPFMQIGVVNIATGTAGALLALYSLFMWEHRGAPRTH